MISAEQIRAARALLNIKQTDLAAQAGLSLASLNNIERQVTQPRIDTLKKIKTALENAGIEFTTQDGVRRRQEVHEVEIVEGKDAIERWFDGLISTLKRTGTTEIMISGIDDGLFLQTHKTAIDNYLATMQANNFDEKILICEGDHQFYASTKTTTYRWTPKAVFSQVPYAVCGDTYSIIAWGPPIRLTMIRNQTIADSMRRHFMYRWENAITPDELKPFDPR